MAYNKRYRVTHTFENGSRFIGNIGVKTTPRTSRKTSTAA